MQLQYAEESSGLPLSITYVWIWMITWIKIGPNQILSGHQLLATTDANRTRCTRCRHGIASHLQWSGWLYWAKLLTIDPIAMRCSQQGLVKTDTNATCPIHGRSSFSVKSSLVCMTLPFLEIWSHSHEIWPPRAFKKPIKNMSNETLELNVPWHLHWSRWLLGVISMEIHFN